jgi:hypothetical protein
MVDTFCACCGQPIPKGSLKYIVQIKIISDFDGFIPYCEENPSEEIQKNLKEMEDMDVQELEDDVYQEFSGCLCMHCKKKFTGDLTNSEEEDSSSKRNFGNLYH